ncbi:hypothetical protein CEK26_001777 [Fusarium fujikuroi]|nr:hypothetical protein CEK26_001777 [Fusarium fujikuroi]
MTPRIPTIAEIRASTEVLSPTDASATVVNVGKKFAVKFGHTVSPDEAEALKFLSSNSKVPVPEVYATLVEPETGITFIVVEYINAKSLADLWPSLEASNKLEITNQLRAALQDLRSLEPPSYLGSLHRRPLTDGVFWIPDQNPVTSGPFNTEEDLNEVHLLLQWCGFSTAISISRQWVINHQGPPENLCLTPQSIVFQTLTMATMSSQHEAHADTSSAKTGVEESQSELPICDWTEKAEVKLRRKIDFTILPMLMLGLFALQLDRGNVGYAMTTSFTEDLGINNDNVNTGNQLMLAAVVIFEIPFNMVLSKIGPALWLIIQILAWGTIATAQAAVHNKPGFYATRFLLGMWEAGYLAAALTILASFYTRKEMAMRATLVYVGNYCSAGVSGLLAGLIFRIPETSGLKKWQWLFIIDGLFTLAVGFVFILIMPRSTTNTLPLAGVKWFDLFTAEERDILAKRVIIDDPRKHVKLSGISPKTALRILLTSFPMWGHFGINVISITPKGGLVFYTPTIIKNLGFGASTASFLAAVSNFGVCILAILVSWVSDKTLYRGPLCLLCGVYSLVFSGVQFAVVGSSDVWMKYAILTLLGSGVAVSQSLNDAWFSINTEDPQVRCIGLALAVAGSNVGGLAGQNIFVKSDAPYYRNGFLKILCLYAASIVLVAGMIFYYWNDNRRMEKSGELEEAAGTDGSGGVKKRRVKNQL